MKIKTSTLPIISELKPCSTESSPRLAPTVRSSRISIGAGKDPERKTIFKVSASSTVNCPEIEASPPVMASRITGADCTLSSNTIAMLRPTLRRVIFAKRSAPIESKESATYGLLSLESMRTLASRINSPVIKIFLSNT